METISQMENPGDLVRRAKELLKKGDFVGVYDVAQGAIESGIFDTNLAHMAVLSLARSGATGQAIDLFYKFQPRLPKTEKILSLHARLFKDEFLNSHTQDRQYKLGLKARDLYLRAYNIHHNYYPAINAATLSFLIEDNEAANDLAKEVIRICGRTTLSGTEDDYYLHVTQAEALLLLLQDDKVPGLLEKARQANPSDYGQLSVTFRQLELICNKRGIGGDLIEMIRPPAVITYSGQMIHGFGKSPGMDPADVPLLQKQISALLKKHNIKIAYGSLACGADTLVAEEVLKQGGELNIALPFSKEEFKRISVSPAGRDWEERFERALEQATSVSYIVDDAYTGLDLLFEACSLHGMGMAHLRSQTMGSRAYQIAVWNCLPGTNKAGTAGAMERWKSLGEKNLIIETPKPRCEGVKIHREEKPPKGELKRQMKSMIFADIKGYSSLAEKQLPSFVANWMDQLNKINQAHLEHIHYVNTWGDAIFMVVDTAPAAAQIALELAQLFPEKDIKELNLPGNLGFRVAAHIGPIFETSNLVTGQKEFFGTHVVKTARLEPCTPVRSVYVTEPFAAVASIECDGQYRCEYVGNQPLPKGFGKIRMYHLTKIGKENL